MKIKINTKIDTSGLDKILKNSDKVFKKKRIIKAKNQKEMDKKIREEVKKLP